MTPRRPLAAGWVLAASVVVLSTLAAWALDLRVDALESPQAAARAFERASAFARGFTHPDLSGEALLRCLELSAETLAVAIVGTTIGAIAGLGLGLVGSNAVANGGRRVASLPARVTMFIARSLLDVLRAIPDFAWALVLLVPLGPGPVTGALAIACTVTGVLGRTYGQLVDGVPHPHVRAVESLGAGRVATAAYGRLPRIAAAAWSYTLIRLECSVRNASVIGVVGGGGLGAELFEELGYGQDDRVATLLLTLLVLTAGADLTASWTRRRLRGSAPPRARRSVALVAGVSLGLSLLWLVPAAADVAARFAVDDQGFAADSLRKLMQPDLRPTILMAAFTSCAIPLAMAWLATMGSVVVALTILPWSSSYLTVRAAGLSATSTIRWVPVLALRTTALVSRAIPDVAWLLLFAAALRMGHAAALVALLLHSTGVMVRVFCETVDDAGVRDRVHGPGGRAAWLAYRLQPRVRSTMVTHSVLQGEANLRAAVVLGIVGAGGLGDAFHTAVTYWRLPQASTFAVTMVIIFVVVDRIARWLSRWSVRRATTASTSAT